MSDDAALPKSAIIDGRFAKGSGTEMIQPWNLLGRFDAVEIDETLLKVRASPGKFEKKSCGVNVRGLGG